jgi:hypothetical protein
VGSKGRLHGKESLWKSFEAFQQEKKTQQNITGRELVKKKCQAFHKLRTGYWCMWQM